MELTLTGGDRRMLYTAKALSNRGFSVRISGFETLGGITDLPALPWDEAMKAKNLLLGQPLTKDGKTVYAPFASAPLPLRDVFSAAENGSAVFVPDTAPFSGCKRVFPYGGDEDFLNENARLTAEAAVGEMILSLPCSLKGARIGLLGYGRIASALAGYLSAFGAESTVFARSAHARIKAAAVGAAAFDFSYFSRCASGFDAVVNTVPARVLDKEALGKTPEDCVFFELASAPGGFTEGDGRTLLRLPGLPGRVSPKSAGVALANAVEKLLKGGESQWTN